MTGSSFPWFRRLIPVLAAIVAATTVLGACQFPLRITGAQDGKRPAVSNQEIPDYPWPKPRGRTVPSRTVDPYLTKRPEGSLGAVPDRQILPPSVVRVAILLPLSGSSRALGQAMLNAAQLAMFSFAGEGFQLTPHDTGGTPNGAAAAAHAAITEGASLVIGPLLAPSMRAVTPLAQAAGVPVIGFSSDRTVAAEGIYTMGVLPGDEVRRVIGHALAKGIYRFAAVAPDNAYGAAVLEVFQSTVEAGGGMVERIRLYDPMATDFAPVIRDLGDFDERREALLEKREELEGKKDEISVKARERLEQLQTLGDPPFEALLVADGGKRLQVVAALLPFYDIDPKVVRMLGTGQWDVPDLGAEPALIGGWYAAPPPASRRPFEEEYAATFGTKPPRLATLAYDATALVAVLAAFEGGPAFGPATITDPVGFAGRDGIFRFLPGGLAERGLAVLQVRRHDARAISRAPETFEPLLY